MNPLKNSFVFCLLLVAIFCRGQEVHWARFEDSANMPAIFRTPRHPHLRTYAATAHLLDAALTSLNSLHSLIRKDNYRNRIASFNNPASSDLGFSLEAEIQLALRPILEKTRNTNTTKFTEVVSLLIGSSGRPPGSSLLPLLPAVSSLVSNLAINEKRVSRADIDSFLQVTGRYFAPYEKLDAANKQFEVEVERLSHRVQELQFDIREYTVDMVQLLHPKTNRSWLKDKTIEELLLLYLDLSVLESLDSSGHTLPAYPSDGVKGAKELANTLQKLFRDYQKMYGDNYSEIRSIIQSARGLVRHGNAIQVETSLKELEDLYNQSAQADVLNLRLNTLSGRLQALVLAAQPAPLH
jgi:hypothetical protein